jgi:hypothetical protein
MTMSTFRVRFTDRQFLAINISAATEEDAIDLARDIRRNRGTDPFEVIGDGDPVDCEVESLQDDGGFRFGQVLTALTRLRTAAAKLDAALDGPTVLLEKEQRRLAEALAAADPALLGAKGGAR